MSLPYDADGECMRLNDIRCEDLDEKMLNAYFPPAVTNGEPQPQTNEASLNFAELQRILYLNESIIELMQEVLEESPAEKYTRFKFDNLHAYGRYGYEEWAKNASGYIHFKKGDACGVKEIYHNIIKGKRIQLASYYFHRVASARFITTAAQRAHVRRALGRDAGDDVRGVVSWTVRKQYEYLALPIDETSATMGQSKDVNPFLLHEGTPY